MLDRGRLKSRSSQPTVKAKARYDDPVRDERQRATQEERRIGSPGRGEQRGGASESEGLPNL